MTSKKEGTNMGKKKKGYGKIAVLMLVLTLILAFSGIAIAEQEWLPGYGDKNGRLGKDGQSWRIGFINTLCMEGTTSDTSEACIRAVTLTADRFYNTPDASGTIALTESIGSTITLADTQLLVGQSTGLGAPKTMTGDGSITNGLVFSLEAGTDAQMMIYNAGDGWAPDTISGDGSITNTGVFSIEAGTDAQFYVYNAGDGAAWKTLSGDATIVNTGEVSLEAGTDAQMFIYNATEKWGPKTLSGDITITNAGVASIGANKVGTSEFNVTTVVMNFAASKATTTETVTSGVTILGVYPFANIVEELINSVSVSGTVLTGVLNKASVVETVFKVVVLEP